ncbi:hypothetical protein Tco_0944570 [Tanacetum coccineum]
MEFFGKALNHARLSNLLQLHKMKNKGILSDDKKVQEKMLNELPVFSKEVEKLYNNRLGDMIISIPNVEDDGEVLHTVRVEYEWKPLRCGVCMVYGHADMLCPKRPIEKPKKQHTNHDGFQDTSSYHGTNVGSKVNDVVNEDNDSEVEEVYDEKWQ